MNQLNYTLKIIAALTIILAGVSYVSAAPWTAPSAGFPNNNVDAPINAGSAAQIKTGILTVGGFGSTGSGFFSTVPSYALPASLLLGINGKVGAVEYCDQLGSNCSKPIGNTMQAPAYDSGWQYVTKGDIKTFTHNLGTLDTFVQIEALDDNPDNNPGNVAYNIHMRNFGTDVGSGDNEGFVWQNKTAATIDVKRSGMDNQANQVRVRMWKIAGAGPCVLGTTCNR